MKLSVVIPAHNEEDHIEDVTEELREELSGERIDYELIIVDDNSRDSTGELADGLAGKYKNVRVVHRSSAPGFGRAIRDGLAVMRGDCVILVMADKSDDPKDVVKIFRKLEEGYDVVYGSRFIRGSKVHNYPTVKLIINRLANHFIMALFFMRENDITNAFKGYNTRVIKALWPFKADHFNITAELPLKARARNYSKTTVPVRWYGRESGLSKLSILKMGKRYLRTVLEIWFAWIHDIKPRHVKGEALADEDWDKFWTEKENNSLLGKTLFMFRQNFWVPAFIEFALKLSSRGRVLEAGSGSALSSILLSRQRGDDISALDMSQEALKTARESSVRLRVPIKLIRGDMYNLPFADGTFDLVWNSGTVEHFRDPVPVLKEMGRVGTEIICIVPAEGLAFSLLAAVTGMFGKTFKSYFLREDETLYSVDSLSAVMKTAGFKHIVARRIYCLGVFPYIAAHCKIGS